MIKQLFLKASLLGAYGILWFSIQISSPSYTQAGFLNDLSFPAPLASYAPFIKIVQNIYHKKEELELTKTYKCLTVGESVILPLYYYLNGSGFLGAVNVVFGRYPSLTHPLEACAKRILPQSLQPSFHATLKLFSIALTTYNLYENFIPYTTDILFGLVGTYLTHHVLRNYDFNEVRKKEIEAFALYGFRKVGWYSAQQLNLGINTFLKVLPAGISSIFNFPQSLGVGASELPQLTSGNPTVFLQCSLNSSLVLKPEKCDEICGIQYSWLPLKDCLQETQDWVKCRIIHEKKIKYFAQDPSESFYSNIEKVGNGGSNVIVKGQMNQPRLNMPQYAQIAIRITPTGNLMAPIVLNAYAQLDKVKSYTDVFTEINGFYFANYIEDLPTWYTKTIKSRPFFYTEMEYIPYSALDENKLKFDYAYLNSYLFEICISEWLEKSVAYINLQDYKPRHFMFKEVNYPRVYEIGSDLYSISSPILPKRVDYDIFSLEDPNTCYLRTFSETCKAFDTFRSYLSPTALQQYLDYQDLEFFAFIFQYFSSYKISEIEYQRLLNNKTSSVKRYRLLTDCIPTSSNIRK